jgi:RsiW-degrading membrane proteinase PrsW (M82 family)
MAPAEHSVAVVMAGASAIAWVLYFRWKDAKRPEPLWVTAAAVCGGMMALGLAVAGYAGSRALGVDTTWEDLQLRPLPEAALAALRIGAIEETAKLAAVLPIALWAAHFDELLDGIIYVACGALGFATAETVLMLQQGDWDLWPALGRAVAGPMAHALFSAPSGLGLALLVLRGRRGALAIGLAISIAFHGAYDLLLARPNIPAAVAPMVVLALWLWLLRVTPGLARLEPVPRS